MTRLQRKGKGIFFLASDGKYLLHPVGVCPGWVRKEVVGGLRVMFTTRLRAWQEKMGGLGTGARMHGCVCLYVCIGGEGRRMPCDHFLSLLLLLWARGWVSGIT